MMLKMALKNIRPAGRIIFLFLSIVVQNIGAQSYFFDNYSVDKGLANTKVYAILQDKNHLIWLGTPNGVSTFDGHNFENYTTEKGLAENGVWTIFQDSKGNIWFGHIGGGISRYNGKIFESIPANVLFKKDIYSFCEDDKGKLWITSVGSGATLISNPDDPLDKLKYEQYQGKRLSDLVFSCIHTHDNKIYFITDVVGVVKVFNHKTNNFDNLVINGMTKYFQITTMFEDSEHNFWFGTYHGGLYKYIPKENNCKFYDIRDGLSSNWITSITQDRNGVIWVGTWNGITKIDGQKLSVFNAKNGLPGDNIYCITQDTEGNMLIGSSGQGFSIFKGEAFISYESSEMFPKLPNSQIQVWSILQDSENNFWFGTNGGVSIYNPSGSKTKIFSEPTKIRYMKEDKNKNIWIGTDDQGMFLYNRKTNIFRSFFEINSRLPSNSLKIKALNIDQKGNLWIGTIDGLYTYNIYDDATDRLSQENGLPGNSITAIYIDKNNIKYIGCEQKGLIIFSDSLTLKTPKYPLLGNTTPKCIITDNLGNAWIGTEGQGLLCFKNGKIIKRYQKKDGLLSDLITLVNTDDEGNIYIGTSLGLNKLNNKGTILTYTEKNGFTGVEAEENAVSKDKNGCFWFGTAKGAICYNPKSDNIAPNEPLTRISKITVNYKERPLKDGLRLRYNENSIVFDYSSFCLTNPDAVEFRVMLEGADIGWQPVTKQTSWPYSGLPPNKYVFKVIAKNSAGIWNSKPVTFAFRINPPFYQTWWFITICIVIGAIGVFVYIKIRERNLIKEKEVLEETVKERTAEVVKVNQELAGKNKDVMDSITYASRIQNAVLPVSLPFDNAFALLRPKDVVSGDFFWFLSDGDKEWISAVDCTGHGVPGAFMSIIGNNSLNVIVKELGITQPAEILKKLDEKVAQTLHQYRQDDQILDGMDIALMSYDYQKNLLEFAGAYNPLWLVRKGELIEIPASRCAIGLAPNTQKEFINHQMVIEPGDTIYLFSDGYADQFGGSEGKKLKVGKFRNLILSLHDHQMEEQKKMLEQFLDNWKGKYPQIDDILIIGRRFD
jgi:ligand-binding sensor domain-containing protein/serine phosphatase RsbU (regulator of sigma subunit)